MAFDPLINKSIDVKVRGVWGGSRSRILVAGSPKTAINQSVGVGSAGPTLLSGSETSALQLWIQPEYIQNLICILSDLVLS